jgi:hypothetical protein
MYLKPTPNIGISVQAKDTREGGEPTQAAIGRRFYHHGAVFAIQ